MRSICRTGDKRTHSFEVTRSDFPAFKGKVIHKVCSTYALAREIEWTTRLFVIDMIDEDEEGIGTMLKIDHISPALEKEKIIIEAMVESMTGKELICSYTASAGDRVIAKGKTGQKVLKKETLNQVFSNL